MTLSGKVALVTGASGWLGSAMVLGLRCAGVANVIEPSLFPMDVTVPAAIATWFDLLKIERLDILINAAHSGPTGDLFRVKPEDFDAVMRVNVTGGGPNGQAGAVRHGIARALLVVDAALRPALKAEGLLTRDPRMRERKKYGQPGARKRFQFSKR